MSEKRNWRISSLLRESAERFDKHSNRIGKILDRAQDMFEQDHSSTVGVIGIALQICAITLAFWKEQWALSGVSMAIGAILLITAVLIRHKSRANQIEHTDTLVKLEKERVLSEQKTAILKHIELYGPPEGTSLVQIHKQIQSLLGDFPSPYASEAERIEWQEPVEGIADEGEKDINE